MQPVDGEQVALDAKVSQAIRLRRVIRTLSMSISA